MKQITLPLPILASMEPENFVVGNCNRLALALINSWPDRWSLGVCITGASGCGKTHLVNMWRQLSGAADMAALLRGEIGEVAATNWFIDDIEKWIGDESGEEALFHRLNSIKQSGGTILITSQKPPALLDFKLPDVRSRIMGFTVAEIGQPDDETLAAVLRKHLVDRQLRADGEFINYLLNHTERSFAAVKKAVADLDEMSLEKKRVLNSRLAHEWLKAS